MTALAVQQHTAQQMTTSGNDGSEDEQRAAQFTMQMQPIVSGLEDKLRIAVNARGPLEQRWLKNLRQYHGRYDEETATKLRNDPDRSAIFINMTGPKTTAWEARLCDLLFPTDDKNWGINPTPVPELTERAEQAAADAEAADARAIAAVDESNAMVDAGADPAAIEAKRAEAEQAGQEAVASRRIDIAVRAREMEAKKRSQRMETEIADQLVECLYSAKARDVISDSCKLGSGVMKGPITANRPRKRWTAAREGGYALDMSVRPTQEYRRVNPWNFFPDPDAGTMTEAGYCFERHPVNRQKFTKMAQQLGFHMPALRSILREGPANGTSDLNYISQLRAVEGGYAPAGDPRSLFVVWEYHGYLETREVVDVLRAFGRDEEANEFEQMDDPTQDLRVVAYFCAGRLLKLAPDYPMDSGEYLYSVYPFEKSETSILGGVGIPEMMSHEQAMLNSAVRMMMDNAGLAVAPQRVIDKTRIEPVGGGWKVTPGKAWLKTGEGSNPADRAMEFIDVPMNTNLAMVVVDLALRFIDLVISMPTIAQGEQGQATGTFGGMSMLFNSANVVFRRNVKNFDDEMTTPNIRRAFDWNMQFSEKDEIKGDMQIEARGTSVLLVREVQAQQFMAIATQWSQHPILAPAIKVYDMVRLTLQTMSINPNDVLVTPEEFEKKLKDMAENSGPDGDTLRAQSVIEAASIRAQSLAADGETRLQVAGMQKEVAIMELMMKENLSFAQIEAGLAKVKMDNDSKERGMAVEAALEQKNADRAAQMGRIPTGSGGAISLGSEPMNGGRA